LNYNEKGIGGSMRKLKLASVVLLGVFSLGALSAQAGILGRSYVEGTFQYTKVDKDEMNSLPSGIDDHFELYGLCARLGGIENMDVVGGFGVGSWDGNDLTQASAGIQPYWKPDRGSYKVFADAEILYTQVEDDFDNEDSDTGYTVGVGSELCASKQLSVIGMVSYFDVADDDDISFSGLVNFWVTDWLLVNGGASYAVDSKAISLGLGVGIGF
jgi:hypothetical protein